MHPILALQAFVGPIFFHLMTRPTIERIVGLPMDPEDAVDELVAAALEGLAAVMATGAAPTPPAPAVEAVGLRKQFGRIHAVDGVDLALAPGRIYGLLGPNGSGKTTLIRMLAGLARATGGEARILGTKMPSRPTLARIGYMPQAEALYPELSVGENLGFFASLLGRRGPRGDRPGARPRRAGRPEGHAGAGALRRHAPPAVARVHARARARGALPRRADRRRRPRAARPVLGALPAPRRGRHDDPRREPRHGRGRSLRRARVHARRQGHRAGDRRRAPGPGRHDRPRGRVPRPVRPRRRGPPARRRPRRAEAPHEPAPDPRHRPPHRPGLPARRADARADVRRAARRHGAARLGAAASRWTRSSTSRSSTRRATSATGSSTALQDAAAEPDSDIAVAAELGADGEPEAEAMIRDGHGRPRDRDPRGPARATSSPASGPTLTVITEGTDPAAEMRPLRHAPGRHGRRRAASSCRPASTRRCCPQVERRTSTSRRTPTQADVLAPIFLGFFGYFFVFLLTGVSFLRERIGGTLERLLATPVTRFEIVIGYSLGFGIFATLQVIALTLFILNSVEVPAIGPLPPFSIGLGVDVGRLAVARVRDRPAALARRGQPRHLPVDVRPDRAPGHPVHPARDRAPGAPERHPVADRAPARRPPGDRARAAADLRGRGPARGHAQGRRPDVDAPSRPTSPCSAASRCSSSSSPR